MQVNNYRWHQQWHANVSEFTHHREEESFAHSFSCMVEVSGLTGYLQLTGRNLSDILLWTLRERQESKGRWRGTTRLREDRSSFDGFIALKCSHNHRQWSHHRRAGEAQRQERFFTSLFWSISHPPFASPSSCEHSLSDSVSVMKEK